MCYAGWHDSELNEIQEYTRDSFHAQPCLARLDGIYAHGFGIGRRATRTGDCSKLCPSFIAWALQTVRLSKEKKNSSKVTMAFITIWATKSVCKSLKISPILLQAFRSHLLTRGSAGEDCLSLSVQDANNRAGAWATALAGKKKKVLSEPWGTPTESVLSLLQKPVWSGLLCVGVVLAHAYLVLLKCLYYIQMQWRFTSRYSGSPWSLLVFCSAVQLHDFNVNFWSISFPFLNHRLGFWLQKPHQCHAQSGTGEWRQFVWFCIRNTNCTNRKGKQPTGNLELFEIFI